MRGDISHDICTASLDLSPCEVHLLDPASGRFVAANRRALDNLKLDLDALRGLGPEDIFDAKTARRITALRANRGAADPVDQRFTGSKHCADGSSYDVSVSLRAVAAPEPAIIVVTIDISRRRAAQHEARMARQTLEASIEALPHGFVLYDDKDRLVICNQQYRRFYPRSAHAMLPGITFRDILQAGLDAGEYLDAIGREDEWLKERMNRHEAADAPVFQHLADGRHLQIIERRTADGGRVGLRIDITDHVTSRQRAERAEQRLRDAIRVLPAGFWLFDDNDRLVTVNDRFREIYGRSSDALEPGTSFEDVLRNGLENGQYPDAIGREEEWLSEVLKKRQSGSYELTYQLDDGRWVHSLNEPTSEGGLVGFRMDITERKLREAALEHNATTDTLTGLLNRRGMQKELERLKAELGEDDAIAFLHIDLDRFKPVNDVFGHQFGDMLLEHVARTLRLEAEADALVARVGGDEFLLAHVLQHADDPLVLADRLRSALSEPITFDGQACRIGASIGVALWRDDDPRSIEEAMQDADIALNASKGHGRNTVTQFEPSMRAQSVTNARIAEDVVRGLDAGEFTAHFQPILSAGTLSVAGFECLARWQHPDRGLLTPDAFMTASESAGLLGMIDRAVLNEAVRFAAMLKELGRADLRVSINLSSTQLKHPGIVEQYLWVLECAGVDPAQFRVEVLESTLLEDRASHVVDNIRRFRQHGFLIDLDDFGTGHTAIASLHRYPVDRIKIDRSLVKNVHADPELEILTDAIVSLGRRLGLHVLAEGIESPEEFDVLRKMGCTCVQGFLWARPMSAADCVAWLEDRYRSAPQCLRA